MEWSADATDHDVGGGRCRSSAAERWVVVGGTFDPIHVGHVQLARAAVEQLGARVGVLAVGAAHPHRPPVVLPWHARVRLVRDALADEPTLTEASAIGATCRDITDVARSLVAPGRELHFVFGSDSAARLTRWSGGVELLGLGTVWAVERADVATVLPGDVEHLELQTADVSSTEVRARCASGADIDGFVPRGIHAQVVDAYGTTLRRRLARLA